MEKPIMVELKMREEDVEAVIKEFEAENPGKSAADMTGKEFADRLMAKMVGVTLTVVEGGNA